MREFSSQTGARDRYDGEHELILMKSAHSTSLSEKSDETDDTAEDEIGSAGAETCDETDNSADNETDEEIDEELNTDREKCDETDDEYKTLRSLPSRRTLIPLMARRRRSRSRTTETEVPSQVPKQYTYGHALTNRCVQIPCICSFLLLLLPLLCSVLAISKGYKFNTDIRSFRVSSDHEVQAQYDALELAKIHSKTYFHRDNRRLSKFAPQRVKQTLLARFEITIEHESNVLTPEGVNIIRNIENLIKRQPTFKNICWLHASKEFSYSDFALGCAPPLSLTKYFFPSVGDSFIEFDGEGSKIVAFNATLKALAATNEAAWFVDSTFSAATPKSKFLRAVFLLRQTSKTITTLSERIREYKNLAKKWATTIRKYAGVKEGYRAIVGGDHVTLDEFEDILKSDLKYVSLCAVLVFIYASVELGSFILSCFAFFSILLTIPTSLYVYSFYDPCISLGILNVLSVYIIFGIGYDDIYMFCAMYQYYKAASTVNQRFCFGIFSEYEKHFYYIFHNRPCLSIIFYPTHSSCAILFHINGNSRDSKLRVCNHAISSVVHVVGLETL